MPPELTPRNPENLFALRVKGYSMIDALITDGDIVVLTPTSQARNGEMVAAWLPLEETATLKRFYLEGDHVAVSSSGSQAATISPFRACEISSTSVVDYNLRLLERDGYIRRSPDISRGLELVGEEEPTHAIEVIEIPVLGAIAAGEPIPVPESEGLRSEGSETISLPPELTPRNPENLFALRVKGYSMIDALITDGDIVVLTPTSQARNGESIIE